MDIAGVSSALAAASTKSQVGVAMLSKSLDTNEVLGQGMVEMLDSAAMERSVAPHLGGNIDLTA